MKTPLIRAANLASPKQQHNWDWRAASNFVAGGAGGGLLLLTAFSGLANDVVRTAMLLGMILIAGGLTCVWLEIGRPLRALNVYRHVATSWMTREAMVALALFLAGGLAVLTGQPLLVMLTGLLGLTFLYSQARILAANKGIPAWRHPRSVPLMVSTGLAEGAGFLACTLALSSGLPSTILLAALLTLIVIRAFMWKSYLGGLIADGAPEGALKVLKGIDTGFLVIGHLVPGFVIVAMLAGMPGRAGLMFLAGIVVVASGWFLKYRLVRRAAFTQGLALPHLPVRGRDAGGGAAKPGWKVASKVNVG